MADPNFSQSEPINIILRADSYSQIIKPNLIQGPIASPVVQLTIFGWIIFGLITNISTDNEAITYHCSVDRELQVLLTKFWLQEEIPKVENEPLNHEEKQCEDHFRSTVSRDKHGRYIVRLPLSSPTASLGDSTSTALRGLSRLNRRFQDHPAYFQLYNDFLQEYLYLGHMTLVPPSENKQVPVFYLPHGVLREQRQTTKLRVVFNGSSRSSNGVSLNDILYAGPKLQNEISDVLLWFRVH